MPDREKTHSVRSRQDVVSRESEQMSYRVFICYEHSDLVTKEALCTIVKRSGMIPWADDSLVGGTRYTPEIQERIASSHVFMPILSAAAKSSPYVQQEIGFAVASHVPVLPVAMDAKPAAMISQTQAVLWNDDADQLGARLLEAAHRLVRDGSGPIYECARSNEDRISMHAGRAETLLRWECYGRVRHKGWWSSFSLPNKPPGDDAWVKRYGGRADLATTEKCQLLRREHRALVEHAKREGCSIILNQLVDSTPYGAAARVSRLRLLLRFLRDMSRDDVEIVLTDVLPRGESETIIGDWYLVHGSGGAMKRGYSQSVFTRHAPTVWQSVRDFDDDLRVLLDKQKVRPRDSKSEAERKIDEIVERETAKLKSQRGSS